MQNSEAKVSCEHAEKHKSIRAYKYEHYIKT